MDTGELVYENRYTWTEEDNMYVFCFEQDYCGLNVVPYFGLNYPHIDNTHYDKMPSMVIAFNDDGIVYMEAVLVCFDDNEERVELLDYPELSEKISHHYNQIIDNYTYEVTKSELVGYTENDGSVRPVWLMSITCHDINDAMQDTETTVAFDAETGKQIIIN